jgi:hypothetical protein
VAQWNDRLGAQAGVLRRGQRSAGIGPNAGSNGWTLDSAQRALRSCRRTRGLPRRWVEQRAADISDDIGLGDQANRPFGLLVIDHHQTRRMSVPHQVRGRSQMSVGLYRRERWPHDVRCRGRSVW